MVNRVTELTHRVDSAELASRRGVTDNSHRRRLTGKSTTATRRQLLGSERMVAGHGGSGERRSETIPGGAWTTRARTSKLRTRESADPAGPEPVELAEPESADPAAPEPEEPAELQPSDEQPPEQLLGQPPERPAWLPPGQSAELPPERHV
uniref:Uncharacterized protein n=1 Tax=Brassica campestris TaxID=3711 RepID=M4EYB8_BRACM